MFVRTAIIQTIYNATVRYSRQTYWVIFLKKDILKGWIKAIRSGKYKQNFGSLSKLDKFCPLGILCDISDKGSWIHENKKNHFTKTDYIKTSYLNKTKTLPKEVASWAGISEEELSKLTCFLFVYNDEMRVSLDDLADMLELKYSIGKVQLWK